MMNGYVSFMGKMIIVNLAFVGGDHHKASEIKKKKF